MNIFYRICFNIGLLTPVSNIFLRRNFFHPLFPALSFQNDEQDEKHMKINCSNMWIGLDWIYISISWIHSKNNVTSRVDETLLSCCKSHIHTARTKGSIQRSAVAFSLQDPMSHFMYSDICLYKQ